MAYSLDGVTGATEMKNQATDQLDQLVTRPGSGWRHLAGPVWEHNSGARIHTIGLIRLPDKTYLSLNNLQEGEIGRLLLRINGGNMKRGLMAWVVNLVNA